MSIKQRKAEIANLMATLEEGTNFFAGVLRDETDEASELQRAALNQGTQVTKALFKLLGGMAEDLAAIRESLEKVKPQ